MILRHKFIWCHSYSSIILPLKKIQILMKSSSLALNFWGSYLSDWSTNQMERFIRPPRTGVEPVLPPWKKKILCIYERLWTSAKIMENLLSIMKKLKICENLWKSVKMNLFATQSKLMQRKAKQRKAMQFKAAKSNEERRRPAKVHAYQLGFIGFSFFSRACFAFFV